MRSRAPLPIPPCRPPLLTPGECGGVTPGGYGRHYGTNRRFLDSFDFPINLCAPLPFPSSPLRGIPLPGTQALTPPGGMGGRMVRGGGAHGGEVGGRGPPGGGEPPDPPLSPRRIPTSPPHCSGARVRGWNPLRKGEVGMRVHP